MKYSGAVCKAFLFHAGTLSHREPPVGERAFTFIVEVAALPAASGDEDFEISVVVLVAVADSAAHDEGGAAEQASGFQPLNDVGLELDMKAVDLCHSGFGFITFRLREDVVILWLVEEAVKHAWRIPALGINDQRGHASLAARNELANAPLVEQARHLL